MQKEVSNIASGSLCFWSWNDLLEKEEIKRQLEDFSKGRFSGVIIHSRAGLRIPYMGEEWFEYYRFAIKQAERLGIDIWIYDEDGWPSGFAGGMVSNLGEKYWAKKLVFCFKEKENYENIIACWRKNESGYRLVNINDAIKGDLICYCEYVKNYVDILSEETVRAFINYTHERYKTELGEYFGTVVKGVFTDEPQYMDMPWSTEIERYWNEKYGSNLLEELYMLYIDSDEFKTFRAKYYKIVSELFYSSFTKQISEWCQKNGLIFTGHFSCEDGLVNQIAENGGVMRHYKAFGMPGIDHLGNRITSPVLCKQLSSVASQFSKPEVLSETFGCAGWQLSFERLAWIWGRQSALGVTKPCFHLSAYSITGRRKRDYPAFFSYHEPWWEEFSQMQKWINGLNAFMKEGKRAVDAVVISPLSSVAANYNSKHDEYISSQYRSLLENLLNIQLDFELGDETLISEFGKIENKKFCIGNSAYNLVIVPFADSYNEPTVRLLEEFEASGGMIWYIGEIPRLIDHKSGSYPVGNVVQNRYQALESAVEALGIDRVVTVRNYNTNKIKRNTILHIRNTDNGYRAHIWTDEEFSSGKSRVSFLVDDADYCVYLINLSDGSKQQLPTVFDGAAISVCIDICACDNVVLELKEEKKNSPSISRFSEIKLIDNVSVLQCEKNALTIDFASFSFGDDIFGEKKPIVQNLQWLYEKVLKDQNNTVTDIGVKYEFECRDDLNFGSVTAVIENEFVRRIKVNGAEICIEPQKWWIDRKFGEYYIGDLLKTGLNEIVLYYEIPKVKNVTTTGFESDRNRFFLPIEPESIYIKGDFDVIASGNIVDKNNYYQIKGGNFQLAAPLAERRIGDITRQNSWFYRGNLKYSFEIRRNSAEERIFIKPYDPHGTAAVIKCADKKTFMYDLNKFIEISDMLDVGVNRIEFLLLGSNRNLMGPHHHINGEVSMVGPSTFAGIRGFEDFVSPNIIGLDTWTDSYSFIAFGCGGFEVKTE